MYSSTNSFTGPNQVVTITYGGGIANVVCQNMDWTGALYNPILFGNSSQTLRIYGSLTFITAMTFSFAGVVYFEATTSGNTVTSAGKTFNNDVVFQGTGGWTLQDDLTTTSVWQLRSGSLSTNGKTVQCNRFSSTEGNVRGLNIANSLIKITGNNTGNNSYYSWDANGTGLTFNSVNSSIVINGGDQKLNNTGTSLIYNNVKVLSGYYASINGGGSKFNIIQSGDPPNGMYSSAPSNMNLYSVHFADSIISYSLEQNNFSYDSVNYVRTTQNLNINSGGGMMMMNNTTSFAKKVIVGKDATIQTNNKIDSLWVLGNATINQNSIIRCDSIFGDGTFNGSYNDQYNGGWQVNQKNDFGRLVVMGNSHFTGINEVEHAVLRGNGIFENFNTIDSLYLSPGRIYQIKAGDILKVNKEILIRGNNCYPIQLRSTIQGQRATLWKPGGIVSGDFLEVRDINATGGATFYAGSYSTNLGNNSGWIFTNSPGYVYGLGSDKQICIGESLSSIDFNGAYSYLWQDGSTQPNYTITKPGLYWVEATYGTQCSHRDSINVTTKPAPVAKITIAEPWICDGKSVQLVGAVSGGDLPYHYSWEPSAGLNDTTIINPIASPATTTNYIFRAISANGCSSRDTLMVNVATPVQVTLTSTDPTACNSPTGTASVTVLGGRPFTKTTPYTYEWNTNPVKNTATVTGLLAGSYVATASDSLGCTGQTTAILSDPGSTVVTLVLSTDTICSSNSATATASGADQYEFFVDGISKGVASSNAVLSLSGLTPGVYLVSAIGTQSICKGASAVLPLTVLDSQMAGGSITGGTAICSGSTSGLLTLSGHTGTVLKWQRSVAPFNNWTDIANTVTTYTSGVLTETTQFRAVVQNAFCGVIYSAIATITVDVVSVVESVTGGTTICSGSISSLLSLSGYTGTIVKWQSSVSPFSVWTDIINTATTYTSGSLAEATQFRAIVQSGSCESASSGATTVTVEPLSVGGRVTGGTSIYTGNASGLLTLSGHAGTVIKWQSSVSPFSVWTDIANVATTYTSGVLTATTQFRAVVQNGSCATANSSSSTITVNPQPVPTITGSANTCIEGSNTYTTEAGMTGYTWTVSTGGIITAGEGTSSLTVRWNATGSQTLSVRYTYSNGYPASATVKTVLVNPLPVPTITGSVPTCMGGSYTYITEANMTGYTWNISEGGTITAGSATNSITVTWNDAGAQQVNVNYINANGCTAKAASFQNVTVNQLPVPPTIAGLSIVCEGTANVTYTTEAGMTGYTWIVSSAGDITSGSTSKEIYVTWKTPGAKTVTVNYTNASGCTAKAVTVKNLTVNPLPLPTITGQFNTCLGVNYNYTTEAGMSGYTWIVSPGGTITDGSTTNNINVTWKTAGVQTISVNYINANGCIATNATEKTVTVNQLPIPTITGISTVCAETTDVKYTTESGMSGYMWTISGGGEILDGASTNTINVRWITPGIHTVTVNYINVNGCTATTATDKTITVNPRPIPTITGQASVCIGNSGITYTIEAAMAEYTWAVSAGGTIISGIKTNTITVVWNTIGDQKLSVNYLDAEGCSAINATEQNVTVNPLPVPTISTSDTTWIGSSYIYQTEADMTNYKWIVSSGGIISTGTETNSTTVKWINYGWQTLSINYVNENGCTSEDATVMKMKVINPPLSKTEGISPNGDGINDILIFKDLKNYPGSELIIFTRIGEKIYESDNYLNDWDGKFLNNGSKDKVTVLSGTYYYVLRLGGTNRTIKGFIYVGY